VSVADLFPLPKRQLIKLVLKVKRKIPATNVKTVPFYLALATGLMHTASCHSLLPSFLQAKRTNIESKTRFWEDLHEHDIAALQYTGGTTGVSKGAMLTHGSLLANMMQILAFGDKFIEPGCEKVLTALPLYHIFAFTVNNLVLFYMGATNVLIPSPRPITNLRKAFEKHDFTWVSGVNTLFNALCHEKWFSDNPPRHLKMSIAGGAPLLKSVADKWESITGTPVIEGYGLTEASPVLTFNPIGGQVKEGSIGVPMPDTRIRIVNDEGICVKPGEPGELIANGPQMMAGYWNRPQETEKTLKEGWLYTGDVAVMDEEGYFKIVDRKKDMILVSGFNVYPNEVEAILSLHPDVLEVAVIGIPDEKSGEVVKAFVVRKSDSLTESQLKEHCKEMMTSYKIPRAFEFRKELPKSPIGKILRKELRDVKKA
jgi:long-chain acyl-CoA synthetase